MSEFADNIGMWWLTFRNRIDGFFMPVMTIIAVITGGICLFSGIHVLRQPILVHILELIFTFSLNMIFLFGLMRKSVEDNIKPVIALPTFVASLVFAVFTLGFRLIPHFDMGIPWNVSLEISSINKSWMTGNWILVSMLVGLLLQFLAFWAVARARFQDIVWPYLAYCLTVFVFQLVANFFLNLANYATKIVGY
jgi:hypothetical protein